MSIGIGIHRDIPHQTYLDDPCERPSLSASMAGVLLNRSPWHGFQAHPRLSQVAPGALGEAEETDGAEEDDSPAQRKAKGTGTLIHALVLGGGAEFVTVQKTDKKTGLVEDAGNFMTDSAKAHRDQILAEGKIPVIGSKFREAEALAAKIRERITLPSLREVTVVWESGGVLCRGRIDAAELNPVQLYDLKTCPNALRSATGNHAVDFGLHIQEASYTDAMETLFPDLAGKVPPMKFVFVETGTCEWVIRTLDHELREEGRHQWERAKALWGACLASGVWPGYSREVQSIECPHRVKMEREARLEGGSKGVTF